MYIRRCYLNLIKKSNYRGVHWHVTCKKWIVYIYHNNKRITVGYFEDEIEGARKYDEEVVKLKGDKAKLNFNNIERICEVKSCNNKAQYKYKNINWLCPKHISQMNQFGKILERTNHDLNEIIEYNAYVKIVLYDIKNIECARAIIDKNNINKVKDYKWYLRSDGYVATNDYNGEYAYLHHIILGDNYNLYRDHKDRRRLNNLESNLRLADGAENGANKSISIRNTSGRVGVHWAKDQQKWCASISFRNKRKNLGYFDDFDEAIKIRENAEIKYFKDFNPNIN